MQLTERRSEGLLRVYDVLVPKAELEQRLSAKILEMQPRMKIKGFRPGKVPASHIRKVYGPSMMQDIINETVQKTTRESLEKVNARPASEPTLDLKSDLQQVAAGQADLQFELSLEIMPDFEPADLKSIEITRPIAAVSDQQVDDALAELARSQTAYEAKDGAAEDGDQVVLDFVGKIDDVAFDGGAANDAQVVIGAKQFIPGFEEGLVGVKAGDEKVVEAHFPEAYSQATLAGKTAQFDAKIKEVRAPIKGDPDDAWASNLGFDSLAALKGALRQRIENDHAGQSRQKAKRALFDVLDGQHSFDLPPRMVEAEFNQIWRQIEADKQADRLDASDAGKSDDELKVEYRKIAERRVRLGLLLAELGRRHKIEVNDQEVSQAIMAQARSFPGQERQIVEMYQRNPNMLAQVRAPIYEEKVVDYLLELIKVTNKDVSREDLFADEDEAAEPVKKPRTKAESDEE